ncbi:hypothetical protein [Luteibacter yeojuensis]|uniref:hypothetical protein n=1 Tax=Luteibacter yeojuensis TaxID=345309 RepID=UPI000AEF1FF7|nr:hypothetical protein [Luteibacter yeojuensis]
MNVRSHLSQLQNAAAEPPHDHREPGNQPPRRTQAEQPNQTNQPPGKPVPADATEEKTDPLKPFKDH